MLGELDDSIATSASIAGQPISAANYCTVLWQLSIAMENLGTFSIDANANQGAFLFS